MSVLTRHMELTLSNRTSVNGGAGRNSTPVASPNSVSAGKKDRDKARRVALKATARHYPATEAHLRSLPARASIMAGQPRKSI